MIVLGIITILALLAAALILLKKLGTSDEEMKKDVDKKVTEAFAEDEVSLMSDEESGMISYHLTKNPSKEAGLLLNSMILGLQNMVDDENYTEYIDLTFEEV